ncbi:SgrR family transcriptional regulator [Enterobacter cloacae]|uniref:Extracellular solute-binding protein n=1 Tax=Enterobacter cloacae subsp. cloacae (strain ATCC 13047 / DSM 30054 / NBRC 13535 / NCTC 10005 / WDCM 00083 / NCDC 279-56) TaxID=716541 RepID=A0A0H3CGI6_ENTCC|nr:SgrR family transcriptional regulator [Enterobacter cloacae]MBP7724173.1 SgrR family transcriptional regulator [Enterobacter sp.]ADF60765.1 extracellular solute-binding protein [Enterobacter cloacae subsp. cloacae ATCC 13047]KGB03485.1 bacterial extracellular solute-binding s, 5 Middle family protein [Enterobacter cloacae]MBW4205691.1 SgrR family transcriptional regulator [Enterobacter cloacae subsp. cloacae]MBW4230916.1 SgrR family transcriptional regulator [Enterobacter cloacae subsp. clo
MRQLNRLKQYQRLWQPSEGAPQQVTIAELASRCFCSERHVRTLLRQAQEAGWLNWHAQPGRGKRGELRFYVSPESLRNTMMEEALKHGQQHNALELAQLAPEELRELLHPFLGGQWQNDTPTLRIPYYRSLDALQPGFLPGRAEQHLAGQVFSGLTRFNGNSSEPTGDLAHHWEVTDGGLRWHFYIRSTLHWHNGDKIETTQLQRSLKALLMLPALRKLFQSVLDIEVTHPQCLTFTLHQPDYWLPHRLATYCSRLAHPDQPMTGSGPFRLSVFDSELVRLESHEQYHLSHPLIKAIEYWITPTLFDYGLGTSCRHPVQIAIGEPDELESLRLVSNSTSLGFCYLTLKQRDRMNELQARRLINIIHLSTLLHTLPLNEGLITPTEELLPGLPIPRWPDLTHVPLPAALTLVYHLPVELHTMANQLKQYLAQQGCELTVIFHDAKTWDGCPQLADADMMMGDRLIGEAPEYTLEQWLRCDTLWPHLLSAPQVAHLQATLDAVQTQADEQARHAGLRAIFTRLMDNAVLTPLFNYQYQISAPPGVNGIRLNTRGWFDFTEAWLPAPRS